MAQVRAVAREKLVQLRGRPVRAGATVANRAARSLLAADIGRFLERPYDPARLVNPPEAPPGSPIGLWDFDEDP
jgi:hypothetical protein